MRTLTKYCQNCGQVIRGEVVTLELSVDDGKYYPNGIPKGHQSQGAFDFGVQCAVVANESFNDVHCDDTPLTILFRKLLREYSSLKDSLLDISPSLYDGCYYDIQGYDFVDIDDNEELEHHLEILERQVKALRQISKGLSELNFIFA